MSYVYDKLRDALGGSSFKTGVVSKNWSPNEVRAIFIMRNFILIADYLKQPKVYTLDMNEVEADLSNPNRRGNLNALLSNRQLSCMEEIYVDSVFCNFSQVIDLEAYVKSMYNQASRLRYYGYVSVPDVNGLVQLYSSAFLNGNMDFTIAKSISGFNYKDLNNDEWYKRHNLRPQYYALDSEKGKLHTYFNKCENIVGSNKEEADKQIKLLENSNRILTMFKYDCSIADRIILLSKFVQHCKICDPFLKKIGKKLEEGLLLKRVCKGLTKDSLLKTLSLAKVEVGSKEKYILSIYQKVGVFDDKDSDVNVEPDGIYRLRDRLDVSLSEALISCVDKDKLYFLFASMRNTEGLPEGKLVEALKKSNMLKCEVTNNGDINGIIRFVYGVCGFTENDFKVYINTTRKEN